MLAKWLNTSDPVTSKCNTGNQLPDRQVLRFSTHFADVPGGNMCIQSIASTGALAISSVIAWWSCACTAGRERRKRGRRGRTSLRPWPICELNEEKCGSASIMVNLGYECSIPGWVGTRWAYYSSARGIPTAAICTAKVWSSTTLRTIAAVHQVFTYLGRHFSIFIQFLFQFQVLSCRKAFPIQQIPQTSQFPSVSFPLHSITLRLDLVCV